MCILKKIEKLTLAHGGIVTGGRSPPEVVVPVGAPVAVRTGGVVLASAHQDLGGAQVAVVRVAVAGTPEEKQETENLFIYISW